MILFSLISCIKQEFQNYTVARDTFLAHLGATLWGSMRHIISPSLSDGSFHYCEKISFQLFFITQEVWLIILNLWKDEWYVYLNLLLTLMQKVRHIKQLPVDLKALMDGLSSLLLPSQKALFSQTMYVVYHVVL